MPVMLISDLITSVLLYAQCSIAPSRSFLVLAGGYLFTTLVVIPHALAYPGAFTAAGLIGGGKPLHGCSFPRILHLQSCC